jgi:hypothetical protein
MDQVAAFMQFRCLVCICCRALRRFSLGVWPFTMMTVTTTTATGAHDASSPMPRSLAGLDYAQGGGVNS